MKMFGTAVLASGLLLSGCGHSWPHQPDADPFAESVFADVYPESRSVFGDVYGETEGYKPLVPDAGGRKDKPTRVPLYK
jgi:hypothetical protein